MIVSVESELPQLGGIASNRAVRRLAIGIGVTFTIVALAAALFGNVPGPHVRAFLPICATLWSTAELLTAFFLCSQFYVAGRLSYALIAVGYAITGLLTIPYLLCFPNVLLEAPLAAGTLQVSVMLWVCWHLAFPTAIAVTHLIDPTLEQRIVPRRDVPRVLAIVFGGTATFAVVVSAVVWFGRDALPIIVFGDGHFSGFYSHVVAPIVVLANVGACAIVARRLRHAKALQLWVAVALWTAALDGLVNATAPGRYTISWYVGKAEALTAASVVLLMLLFEVSTLYRRLFDVASIDPLTGLANRRTLDAELHDVFAQLPHVPVGVSLLMLDLDEFKAFNDTYGHAQGDRVLVTVASVLKACATRPRDRVARYGGEEFVVLLADTSLEGALRVAERIRATVALAPIVLPDGSVTSVTTSIGVAYAPSHRARSEGELFANADRALYRAKEAGRNCVMAAGPTPRSADATPDATTALT